MRESPNTGLNRCKITCIDNYIKKIRENIRTTLEFRIYGERLINLMVVSYCKWHTNLKQRDANLITHSVKCFRTIWENDSMFGFGVEFLRLPLIIFAKKLKYGWIIFSFCTRKKLRRMLRNNIYSHNFLFLTCIELPFDCCVSVALPFVTHTTNDTGVNQIGFLAFDIKNIKSKKEEYNNKKTDHNNWW